MPEERISPEEVESTIAARRELGEDMEPAVVDAFVDRVERAIEARAQSRVAADRSRYVLEDADGSSLALAIVSLGTGIPITAIAAEQGGVLGIALAWAGIVGVNVAQRIRRR